MYVPTHTMALTTTSSTAVKAIDVGVEADPPILVSTEVLNPAAKSVEAATNAIRLGEVTVTPNGEVEGPPRSAHQAPRAHTFFPRPRRVTTHRSRTPPTIVRRTLSEDAIYEHRRKW